MLVYQNFPCAANHVQPLYNLKLALRYKNALAAWSGLISSVLGTSLTFLSEILRKKVIGTIQNICQFSNLSQLLLCYCKTTLFPMILPWAGVNVFWYTYREFLLLLFTYSVGIPYRNTEHIMLFLYHWDLNICKHLSEKENQQISIDQYNKMKV